MAQKIWSLYRITNKINQKVYIGQATNISKRWHDHRAAFKNNKPTQIIHHALIKHGLDNFDFEVIASCRSQDDANWAETELVKQYDSYIANGKGYNATLGGMNAPKTEAFKQQMRDYWANPIWKEAVSKTISKAYQSRSPEEKEKTSKLFSELFKGKHMSPSTEFQVGHKLSSEALEKMIKSLTGVSRPWRKGIDLLSPEVRKRITDGNIGRIPWNKGTIGLMNPNFNTFKTIINWPEDTILLETVNKIGLTAMAKQLDCTVSSVCLRLQAKKLKHNRPSGNSKTTFCSGINHKMAKLNEAQVLKIVQLYNTNNYTQLQLAQQFGVTRVAISGILTGRNWNHITHIK